MLGAIIGIAGVAVAAAYLLIRYYEAGEEHESLFGEDDVDSSTTQCDTAGTQAEATRTPTDEELKEIQNALDDGKNQEAIDLTVEYYGIDTSNVPGGVGYDATESNYGVTGFDGSVDLGPDAMTDPSNLASTIVHETTHANQAAAMRASDPTLTDWPDDTVDYDEAMAYDAELLSADQTGIDQIDSEYDLISERRDEHFGDLSQEDQESFRDGEYPP